MGATIFVVVCLFHLFPTILSQREEAEAFLKNYNENFAKELNAKYKAMFTKAANITDYNVKQEMLANDEFRAKLGKIREKARELDLTECSDDVKRQFKFLLRTKVSTNKTVAKMVEDLANDMKTIYGTTTIPYNRTYVKSIPPGETLHLGNIIRIMGESNDTEELLYVWKTWRQNINSRLREKYVSYVKLNNIGARENGYNDAGEFHRSAYGVDDLRSIVDDFLKELRPFYLELHGYVRYNLKQLYPDVVESEGLIPAHLVGNIWAQSWEGLYNRIVPYPSEPMLDVSKTLQEKHSINGLLEITEDFFTSLGWQKLPGTFWKRSIFKRPEGREVQCYPRALDLRTEVDGEPDVRITICMELTQRDFITIHHEIGHVYYVLFYWDQPLEYREGANPGFHEAVGDVVALSMQTPAHLNAIGLLDEVSQTKEADINFLMKTALEQISFLPFAFVMDQWMWNVYSGDIKPSEYNDKWWQYREKYQGIKNPVERSSANGFDPGAKFHIPGDVPYIRYFFASILMFTFHKRACDLAGNTKPLHQCSIYQSKVAGKAFREMLSLGRSKPWPEALKKFTGSDKLSVEPVKEYFRPLIGWLKRYRNDRGYKLGWGNISLEEDTNSEQETFGSSSIQIRCSSTLYKITFIFAVICFNTF